MSLKATLLDKLVLLPNNPNALPVCLFGLSSCQTEFTCAFVYFFLWCFLPIFAQFFTIRGWGRSGFLLFVAGSFTSYLTKWHFFKRKSWVVLIKSGNKTKISKWKRIIEMKHPSWGWSIRLLCSPRLQLFDHNCSENVNALLYYC